MHFRKIRSCHQWKINKKSFDESRLLYKAPRWELMEEERLPTHYVHGMNILKGKMDTLEDEDKRKTCELKLNELDKPVKTPDDFKESVYDIHSYHRVLKNLRTADLDQVDIEFLTDQGSDFAPFFSDALNRKLKAAQARMVTRDRTAATIQSKSWYPELASQAKSDWKAEEKRLKEELKFLKEEKAGPDEIRNVEAALKNQTNWINRQVVKLRAERDLMETKRDNKAWLASEEAKEWDEDFLKLVHRQIEDDATKKSWLHKLTIQSEKHDVVAVADVLSYEDKLELTNMFLEAVERQNVKLLDNLRSKSDQAKGELSMITRKKPPRISEPEIKEMEMSMEEVDRLLLNSDALFSPNNFVEKLNHVNQLLELQLGNIKKIDQETAFLYQRGKESGEFNELIRQKFETVRSKKDIFTPQRVRALLELRNSQRSQWNEKEDNPVYQNEITGILLMGLLNNFDELKGEVIRIKNPETKKALLGTAQKGFEDIEDQIQNFDQLIQEEAVDLNGTLDQLHRMVSKFTEESIDLMLQSPEVKMADQLIKALEGVTEVRQIKKILQENLDKKNLKLVSNRVFQKEYKPFTTSGLMVFEQKGDEWAIVINQNAFKNPKNGKKLQTEIIHELLHLQYEKSSSIQQNCKEAFLENEQWSTIKQAFIDADDFKTKRPPDYEGDKTQFTPDDWKDEDVMSELFAMQNQIFAQPSKYPLLYQAIKNAGIDAGGLGDAANAARHFKIDDKVYRRGAEGGEDVGDIMGQAEGSSESVVDEESGGGSAASNKNEIQGVSQKIDDILSSKEIGYLPGATSLLGLIKKYNQNTDTLNDKFAKNGSGFLSEVIKERLEKVSKDLSEIENDMAKVSDNLPNTEINPLRAIWNSTTFLSADDFFQVALDIKEWLERRHNRRKSGNAAKVGKSLFENIPLPIISEFGAETSAREQKAESEEVNEWQSRLENKDAWDLIGMLKSMSKQFDPNKDQLKAVLRVLAKKGRIDWQEPAIWKVLTKLQSAVALSPNDKMLFSNPVLLRQKLHQACGEIWDYDEYLSLERDNLSSYESGKEKFTVTFDKIQDQITDRLDQLLDKHRNGESVDPQEYEALLDYSIKKGKSSAEDIMYHLIMGSALGIITADRGIALDSKYVNNWPALQWIYANRAQLTQKGYHSLAKQFFPHDYKEGKCGNEFKNFYWTVIQNEFLVQSRVRKSVSERDWDHDWGRSIACLGDANTAKRFLAGRSGQQETKDTAVENAYVGALQWLEANGKDPTKINVRKEYARQIAWIAMTDGIIDQVAYDRGANDISSRGNASMLNAMPREGGVGNHGDWTVRQHREKIRGFLDEFDPIFFAMLRDQVAVRGNDGKRIQGERIANYLATKYPALAEEMRSVTEIDHVFDKLDAIIQAIVASTDEPELLRIITSLRSDLGEDDM